MKMFSAGVGPGIGIKDYRAVFVFETKNAFYSFITSGLDLAAQADAAAKAGHEGGAFAGAFSVAPGVWVYQITEAGLALQATLQGTKYYKDGKLN
jgi:lipid-binding SYLF domain-containing protein